MKKNLTKKVFAGLMATSMLALTACGGSGSSATTAAPAADTKAEDIRKEPSTSYVTQQRVADPIPWPVSLHS